MIAGKSDIREWFEKGVADGYKYMLTIYDRMGYPDDPDFPVYKKSAAGAREAIRGYGHDPMSEVMEVYNLEEDMEGQLAEKRAYRIESLPESVKYLPGGEPSGAEGLTRLAYMDAENRRIATGFFDEGDTVVHHAAHVFFTGKDAPLGGAAIIHKTCVYILQQQLSPGKAVAAVYRWRADENGCFLNEPPRAYSFRLDSPLYDEPRVPLNCSAGADEPETPGGDLYIRISLSFADGRDRRGSDCYSSRRSSAEYLYMPNIDDFRSVASESSRYDSFQARKQIKDGVAACARGDIQEARGIFESIAMFGDAEAMFELGKLLYAGDGSFKEPNPSRDKAAAALWFAKAAQLGSAGAALFLGYMYDEGDGIPEDLAKAAYWLERAAEDGEKDAYPLVSQKYWRGEGIEKNYGKAAYWAACAVQDTALADWRAKQIKDGGWDAEGILEYACLKTVLDSGGEWAAALIDEKFGGGSGFSVSAAEMERLLGRAAGISQWMADNWKVAGGNRKWCDAFGSYGILAYELDWNSLFDSAENGKGQRELKQGMESCQSGEFARAYAFFRESAQKGNGNAQYNLAVILGHGGNGIGADLAAAEEWAAKAREQGFPKAKRMLAYLLCKQAFDAKESGDAQTARRFFERAAALGSRTARTQLEHMDKEPRL
jgi:TPR repeat protein